MVIITRSAYKRACESSNNSSLSQNNIIPPWCSSGKVFARKRMKVSPSTWEIRSAYPVRENIWEYLREGKVEPEEQSVIRGKRRRQCNCKQRERKANSKSATILCAFVIIALGLMASIWVNHIPKINLLTKHRDKLVSLLSVGRTEVAEECCHTMRHLASQLAQIQHKLRHTLRVRRTMMISTQIMRTAITEVDKKYIEDATVTKGSNTKEWGGQIALWGVVPLWRAAPPPDIVLAQRVPTPSDCWPFSGSSGELMIELSKEQTVRYVSLEHIRPDTAKSAPKQFIVYGILGNGTRVTAVEGEYYNKGPAKQYYPFTLSDSLKRLVFHVLSNQGNSKYTCIYRFHMYRD